MGEFGLIVEQGIIPGGYGGIDSRLQVSQVAQLTDHPPADLLEDPGNVRIAGRLDLDETRLEALVGAIEIDTLKEDQMIVHIEIKPMDVTGNIITILYVCTLFKKNNMVSTRKAKRYALPAAATAAPFHSAEAAPLLAPRGVPQRAAAVLGLLTLPHPLLLLVSAKAARLPCRRRQRYKVRC